MSDTASPTPRAGHQALIDFVVHEAHLLDERELDTWNALFAPEGLYWVPLRPGQTDGLNEASYLYEDALLRDLRIQRLKSPRAFSQQPPSRCLHVLQTPVVEQADDVQGTYRLRTPFHYTESRGDDLLFLVGTARHHLVVHDGALRMALKRVDLLNAGAALPMVQLFI